MSKNPVKKPPINADAKLQNFEEDVRIRAYHLYEARGKEEGHELEDWLRAEEEIKSCRPGAVAA